eukprot:7265221-Heterocapsa_arctica.AAC.1
MLSNSVSVGAAQQSSLTGAGRPARPALLEVRAVLRAIAAGVEPASAAALVVCYCRAALAPP